MAVMERTKREPYPPIPEGEQLAVIVDVYYTFDVECTWEGTVALKDFVNIAVEFDPEKVPMREIDGEQRIPWLANRWTINPERLANELWHSGNDELGLGPVHKTNKNTGDDYGPYKLGERVYGHDYSRAVLRNTEYILPPLLDDNGEPVVFIGSRHGIYKMLLGWGGDDFKSAYESGDLTFESLIGRNLRVSIKNGPPSKKNGQIYSKMRDWFPAAEGQALKPSEGYIRVKDRADDKEAAPF